MRVQGLKFLSKFVPVGLGPEKKGSRPAYEPNHPPLVTNNSASPFLLHRLDFEELATESREVSTMDDFVRYYYPNRATLVCNAITSCFEDDSVFVQRIAYDFIGSHFPLTENMLSSSEKVYLSVAACRSVLRKDESVIRRLYSWLFDPFYARETAASNKSARRFGLALHKVAFGMLLEPTELSRLNRTSKADNVGKSVVEPILIVKRIVEDNEEVVQELFPEIAAYVIRYLEYYYVAQREKGELRITGEALEELKRVAKGLLFGNETRVVAVWRSFASELDSALSAPDAKPRLHELAAHIRLFLEIVKGSGADANISTEKLSECMGGALARLLRAVPLISEDAASLLGLIKDIIAGNEAAMMKSAGEAMKGGLEEYAKFYAARVSDLISREKELARKDRATSRGIQDVFALATGIVLTLQPHFAALSILENSVDAMIYCAKKLSEERLSPALLSCIGGVLRVFTLARSLGGVYAKIRDRVAADKETVPQLMGQFWRALGQGSVTKKVAGLVLTAETVMCEPLVDCIMLELSRGELNSIYRFSRLWAAVEEYYPDHVLFGDDPRCSSQMLDLLSSDQPVVSHACKSWLESARRLGPVVDPLLIQLLLAANEGTEEVVKKYDTRRVLYSLKLLRGAFQAHRDRIMQFLLSAGLGEELMKLCNQQRDKVLLDPVNKDTRYITLVLFLLVKYIRCSPNAALSDSSFLSDNTSVNAFSCDLLRLLLTSFDSPPASLPFVQLVTGPLMERWHAAVGQENPVLQVEILNLVRDVQFRCRCVDPRYAESCRKIFSSEHFLPVVRAGVSTSVGYVREAYIAYVTDSVEVLAPLLGLRLEAFVGKVALALVRQLEGFAQQNAGAEVEGENAVASSMNENDAAKVLAGLRTILHFILLEGENKLVTQSNELVKSQAETKGFLSKTKSALLGSLGASVLVFAHMWREQPPRMAKNFALTGAGMLCYSEQDHAATLELYAREQFSAAKAVQELSGTERLILSIVQPLSQAYPSTISLRYHP